MPEASNGHADIVFKIIPPVISKVLALTMSVDAFLF